MRGFPLVATLAMTACSSGEPAPSAAADAGAVPECAAPPGRWRADRDPPAHCVKEVAGRVVDADARPMPRTPVSVCGVACFAGQTGDDGAFRIPVNARLPDGGYVLFAHGRPRHASLFVRLPSAPPERLELAPPVELTPLSAERAALPADDGPASTVTLGPITLEVAAGTSWELAFEDQADDVDGRALRFAKVPVDRAPTFAAGAALVFAFAPFQAKPSKPVRVTIADAQGLAPGAAVELVVMQDDIVSATNTGGLPAVAAKGRVSADGARVETDPGEGIALFTWLAVRVAK